MILIPISSRDRVEDFGDPFFRTSVSINNVPYILDLRWNNVTAAWYLDVFDGDEDPIRTGLKLMLGTLIGGRVTDSRWPNGFFFIADLSGQDVDANFQALGDRVRLYFIDNDEVPDVEDTLVIPNIPALNLQLAPVDGPGLVYVPQTSAHWTALGITPPTHQVSTQVASSNLTALIGGTLMAIIGTGHTFLNAFTGWNTFFNVGKPSGETGNWQFLAGAMDIAAGESFACLVYGAFSSHTSRAAFFDYQAGGSNVLEASFDSSDDVQFEIEGITAGGLISSPPTPAIIEPFLIVKAATFGGSPQQTYVTTRFETSLIATGAGGIQAGNMTTSTVADPACNYGPVLAVWLDTDADDLWTEGNFDRTLLETLRWDMQF